MDPFEVDETTSRLREALDINALADPQGNGIEFEIDEDEMKKEGDEGDTALDCYDKSEVASNICIISDTEQDEEEDESIYDEEHLKSMPHEMELLYKKIVRLPNSDITPKKDGGVLKQIKSIGVGGLVPLDALVKVHYNAYTDVGQPAYDSTRLRDNCMKLRLGKGQTLLGLELAILSMRKNETSRFLIRHDYAYGEMGCPPRIPQKATIIMDVEVLHFVEQEGVDDYYSMTPEERRMKLTFADIDKVVRAENQEGKEYYNIKSYSKAFGKFKKSVNILQSYSWKNEKEENDSLKLRVRAYVNCALCCSQLSQFGRVIHYCNQALDLDRTNVKALFNKGKALHSLGDYSKAEESLKRARNLDPSNTDISKALKRLAESQKKHYQFEREMCKNMFKSSKSTTSAEVNTEPEKKPETSLEEMDELACSDRFKEIAQSHLQEFKNDSDRTEMMFPPMALSLAEINFILETSASLGLNYRQVGSGSNAQHSIHKPGPTKK